MQVTLLQRNKILIDDVFEEDEFFKNVIQYPSLEQEQQILRNNLKYCAMLKKFRQMMAAKQRRYLIETKFSLKQANALEGFSQSIPIATQQCFSILAQAIINAKNLRFLQIAGVDLHPLLAIELSQGIQANTSLRELNLSGCRMNSFSLQYLFTSLSNHKSIQSLNLFNNQGFTSELMTDMREFLFLGSVPLKNLKLTHCNIDPSSLSFLFRNLKHSKTITSLDVSMMQSNLAALTSLSIGLQHFASLCTCGSGRVLESLNIGDMNIKNNGMEALAQTADQLFYKLNIKEIILRKNRITQDGVIHIEKWLLCINGLRRLDLSENQINEFNCSKLLALPLYELKLSKNEIKTFPLGFFTNVLILNLSQNKINNLGAFQLASILSANPSWIELNLSNNHLKTEGFNSIVFALRDNKKLKKLTVAHCELDGEAIICLMINHEQLQIEYLDVSYNQIRYSLLFVLINYLRGGKIRCLRAACTFNDLTNGFSADDLSFDASLLVRRTSYGQYKSPEDQEKKLGKYAVFQIASFHLRELDFHGNQGIFQPVISSLATYYNKIECLDLSSTKIRSTQEVIDLAIFLQKTTSLHDLSLRDIDLGRLEPEAFKIFAKGLGQNSSIIRLNLSKNKLGRSYVIFKNHNKGKRKIGYYFKTLVKKGLKSYNLEYLDLSQNLLDNDQAELFEHMIKQLKNLSELNLSKNYLGSFTLSGIINGVKQNKRLKIINLSNLNLRCDDLILIGQLINEAESLQSLNISNNIGFLNVGTLYSRCNHRKQKYLSFQDVEVDKSSFANLSKSIRYQSKHLKGVSLDGCRFQMDKLQYLLDILNNVPHLQTLQISQILTVKLDISKVTLFRNLILLQVNQTILCDEFIQKLSLWLTKRNCRIILSQQYLDLSQNYFKQDWIDSLFEAIEMNTSVKNMKLQKCFLGQFDLQYLEIALSKSNIENLDISYNELTTLQSFWSRKLKYIKVTGNKITDLSELFINSWLTKSQDSSQINNVISFMKLLSLDISKCQLEVSCFMNLFKIVQSLGNFSGFQYLKCVVLTDNKLTDEFGTMLREFVYKSDALEELILNKNYFTYVGMLPLFEGVMEKATVRWLDISDNKLDDTFIKLISNNMKQQIVRSLEFLQLNGNQFTKQGIKKLISIMRYQINLFVDNNWSFLQDQQALIVLAQYKRISQLYQTSSGELQSFMKKITMTNCQLTDQFCKVLSETFLYLNFIEQIDLSENPLITMYGKVYMFIQIFDPKNDIHRLQSFYISDSASNGNLFDDGVLRYLLSKLRNFFQKQITPLYITQQKKSSSILSSQMRGQDIVTQFLGGKIGATIIHNINRVFSWLDRIDPPQFIVSTLFIGHFRQNLVKIKIYNLMSFLISIAINSLGSIFFLDNRIDVTIDKLNLYMENYKIQAQTQQFFFHKKDFQFQKLYDGFPVPHGNYILTFWFVIIAVSLLELFFMVQIRRNIKPAFQIISPKLIGYLESKIPHKKEILNFLISIIYKIHIVTQWFVVWIAIVFTRIKYDQSDEIELKEESIILYRSVSIFFLISFFQNVINNLINIYQFIKTNPNFQQADFLTILWKKLYFENYFCLASLIGQICPIGGFQINKKIKINYLVAVELFDFFVTGVPMIIITTFIINFYYKLMQQKFNGLQMIQNLPNYLFTILAKEVLRVLISLYIITTTRPSVIKQYQFNQALTIKKFYKNKQNFIKQQEFDTQNQEDFFQEFKQNMQEWVRKQNKNKTINQNTIKTIDEIDQEQEEEISLQRRQNQFNPSYAYYDSVVIDPSFRINESDLEIDQENFINQLPSSKIADSSQMRKNYNV